MSKKRHQSRQYALQGLYQWQITGQDTDDIIEQFLIENNIIEFDIPYFCDLLKGVVIYLNKIDEKLQPLLINRNINQIDLVERAILRLGIYEMLNHPEVPYRVIINEAVKLAKLFGAEQGYKYVNAILDKLALTLRLHKTYKV